MLLNNQEERVRKLWKTIWGHPLKRGWFIFGTCILSAFILLSYLNHRPGIPNYVLGKGAWIWMIRDTENGDMDAIVRRAVENDLDHVILNAPGGMRSNKEREFVELMSALQAEGIRVFGWGYATGYNPEREADRAIRALQLGADGYVINAEGEYRNQYDRAEVLCKKVRNYINQQAPGKLLAYSTAMQIHKPYWSSFPVEVFDTHCDVAMPQDYWETLNQDPEESFQEMLTVWGERRKKAGLSDKPIIPTGQAYRRGLTRPRVEYIAAEDVASFLDSATVCKGVNFWLWNLMGKEHWRVLRDAPGGMEDQRKKYPQPFMATTFKYILQLWLIGLPFMVVFLLYRLNSHQLRSHYIPYTLLSWPLVLGAGIIYQVYERRKTRV